LEAARAGCRVKLPLIDRSSSLDDRDELICGDIFGNIDAAPDPADFDAVDAMAGSQAEV
jgi:hypothetical protein